MSDEPTLAELGRDGDDDPALTRLIASRCSEVTAAAARPVEVQIRRVVRIIDGVGEAKVSIRRKLVENRLGPVQLSGDDLRFSPQAPLLRPKYITPS